MLEFLAAAAHEGAEHAEPTAFGIAPGGYVALAMIVVILFGRRSRRFLLDSWLLVVVVAIAAVFFFGASQTDVLSTGFVTEARGPSAQLLLHDAVLLPGFWMGFFGAAPWGLGWLDTDMPPIV